MDTEKTTIVGLVPLYKPKSDEIQNIKKYINKLDYCYLLDDSGYQNNEVCSELIEGYSGRVEYILNPENLGLCASVNNGFKLAANMGADWVLIMNPDGTFQNDAISIFKDYLRDYDSEDVAIIAPVFNIDRRPRKAENGHRQIRYADMTGCLYNMKILSILNFYDQNTYFYGLDTEYCLRVRKSGYRIVECSEAVLNHHPAQTFEIKIFNKTIFKCGKDVPQRFYYQFRSAYYINHKYHDFYNIIFHIYKFLKVVFLFDNKKEYMKMIKLGICDAKRNYYGKKVDEY
jgi:rhamnosyltransferase